MRKGVLGIKLNFYPVLAFILAMIGQWLLVFVVLGFAMAVEREEWTIRQCMQAAFLGFITIIGQGIEAFGAGFSAGLFGYVGGSVVTMIFSILALLVYIFVLVLAIIGLVKVAKGQEANVPIVSSFADKAFGRIKQQQYRAPQQPMYNQQYPPQQPMGGQPGAPVPPQQPPMPPQQPQNMGGTPPAPPSGNI